MTISGRAFGGRRSLRRLWAASTLGSVALLAGVTLIAIVASEHMDADYDESMTELVEETGASAVLERAVLESAGLMLPVIYPSGDQAALGTDIGEYEQVSAEVEAAFEQMRGVVRTDEQRTTLDAAYDDWTTADTAVKAAPTEFTPEQVFAGLAAGQDPFAASVWAPQDRLDRRLTELRFQMVDHTESRAAEIRSTQRMIIPLLLGVLAVAIAFAFVGARRVRMQVLEPLEEVGRTASSLSDRNRVPPTRQRGVAEIRAIARTLATTSLQLDLTHDLLEEQARTDVLTALPNRKAFLDRVGAMLDAPHAGRVAVLFVDLDDFEVVNDSMGHAAGDELLQIVARRLQAATRGAETVARLGGDEFAVALGIGDDGDSAIVVARRILDSIDEPIGLDDTLVEVGCSIGIAVAPANATSEDVAGLLADADFAMYLAKSQGTQRYELYSPDVHAAMIERMDRRRQLAEALDREEFELHYQPVLDLADGRLLGFEALVRWNHPTDGLLLPSEFIGVAEETGIVTDVGTWVLETACGHLRELHGRDPSLTMSINVAAQQVTTGDFAATVLDAVLGNGVVPDRVVLEITEATALAAEGASVLDDLRGHGIHIALDDFGTGPASLQRLGELPADIVKIDRSFVTGRTGTEAAMLETIITLAQQLGLEVVAEGIEDPQALDRIRRFQDVAGQGFLLARPMPAAATAAFAGSDALHGADGVR